MGTYLNIDDDPNNIIGKAALLRASAETFRSEAQTLLGEIEAIDGARPWASDKYGQAFDTTYSQPSEGQEGSLRDAVQDGMRDAGSRLITVGDQTISAMTEYQGADQQSASDINQANT